MPLKNHVDGIPHGYQFYQPETNWTAPSWLGWKQLRDAIIQHRLANKRFNLSVDPAHVEWEMDVFNSKRLEAMPRMAHFLLPPESQAAAPPSFPKPQRLAEGVAAVKRTAVGIGVVAEMFGEDISPVALELAEKRAAICAGASDAEKCPKNIRGNLLQRFTAEAVKGFQFTLSVIKEMDLKTSVDSKLGTCSACECPLPFKVHVPLKTIEKNTSAETMNKFDPRCWILSEINDKG